jgi:hypothetical protein
VPDIELLIELCVGQIATEIQEPGRAPLVVIQKLIEQIHPIPSRVNAAFG